MPKVGPYSADEVEEVKKKPKKKKKRRYPKEKYYQDSLPDLPHDKYAQDKYDEDDEKIAKKEGWGDNWTEWDDDYDDDEDWEAI